MQNIAIAKEGDEHQERCLFFFRINRFELLNKSHLPSAGFLGWSIAHPDHPLATPLASVNAVEDLQGEVAAELG